MEKSYNFTEQELTRIIKAFINETFNAGTNAMKQTVIDSAPWQSVVRQMHESTIDAINDLSISGDFKQFLDSLENVKITKQN